MNDWISIKDDLPNTEDFAPIDMCYFDGVEWRHFLGFYIEGLGFMEYPTKGFVEGITHWRKRSNPKTN
jgi:hypothetical protein